MRTLAAVLLVCVGCAPGPAPRIPAGTGWRCFPGDDPSRASLVCVRDTPVNAQVAWCAALGVPGVYSGGTFCFGTPEDCESVRERNAALGHDVSDACVESP